MSMGSEFVQDVMDGWKADKERKKKLADELREIRIKGSEQRAIKVEHARQKSRTKYAIKAAEGYTQKTKTGTKNKDTLGVTEGFSRFRKFARRYADRAAKHNKSNGGF